MANLLKQATTWMVSLSTVTKQWLVLLSLTVVIWLSVMYFHNFGTCGLTFITDDIDSLRNLIASLFQGLAAFFAITVSVSLVVIQLTYGTFSPRLMPSIYTNKTIIVFVLLFVSSLVLNLFLLTYLAEETVGVLTPLLAVSIVISVMSILSVIPTSFTLFNLAHPMSIGANLINRFDARYFEEIPFKGEDLVDNSLPLLQSFTLKAVETGDSDLALRLINSFDHVLTEHITPDNAREFADYFEGFIKKVATAASKEDEEKILRQLVFINEDLEKVGIKSDAYMSNSWIRYDSSTFAGCIFFIAKLATKNRNDNVIGIANAAMYRIQKEGMKRLPPDAEISTFITAEHFRGKKGGRPEITGQHRQNEHIYDYIKRAYFGSSAALANYAIEVGNHSNVSKFVRDIYRQHYSIEEAVGESQTGHKSAVERIAFSDLFDLDNIARHALGKGLNIAHEVASGIESSADYLLRFDSRLAEGHIDLLGHLFVQGIQNNSHDLDPNALTHWVGVTVRRLASQSNVDLTKRLLKHLEHALSVISEKQKDYPNTVLDKAKESLLEEIATAKNWSEQNDEVVKEVDRIHEKFADNIT